MVLPRFLQADLMPSIPAHKNTSVIPVVNLEPLAAQSTAVAKLRAHRPAVHVGHIWYVVDGAVHEAGLTLPQAPEGQPLVDRSRDHEAGAEDLQARDVGRMCRGHRIFLECKQLGCHVGTPNGLFLLWHFHSQREDVERTIFAATSHEMALLCGHGVQTVDTTAVRLDGQARVTQPEG